MMMGATFAKHLLMLLPHRMEPGLLIRGKMHLNLPARVSHRFTHTRARFRPNRLQLASG